MIKGRITIAELEKKKRDFQELIVKENIPSNIKKVSKEKANELGQELYNLISKKGYNDDWEEALKLVYAGANINILVNDGKDTPLLRCCRINYPKTVTALIKAGVDVNLSNNYGTTPLMSAARHNCTDIVKMLIWMGADVNKRCKDGDTALISAFRHSALATINILIGNQAALTAANVEGETIKSFSELVPLNSCYEDKKRGEITHEEVMSVVEEAQQALEKIKK